MATRGEELQPDREERAQGSDGSVSSDRPERDDTKKQLFVRYGVNLLRDEVGAFGRRRDDDDDRSMIGRDDDHGDRTGDRHDHDTMTTESVVVRGGVSLWSILTGVMTALGVLLLGAAITAGIAAASGEVSGESLQEGASEWGVWTGIAFIVATVLAFLWGGYTAGRMARGRGSVNGLLVPIVALAIGAGVTALADAMGASVRLQMPFFGSWGLPVEQTDPTTAGVWVGIASFVAMLIAGTIGGWLGARWHTRLERPASRPHGRRMAA